MIIYVSIFALLKTKKNELKEVIIATKHITFSAKADIIRCLLERRQDVTKQEAKKIHTTLIERIGNKRNMVAHYALDNSMTAINRFEQENGTISLLKYSNIKTVQLFTKKDFTDLLSLILAVRHFFIKFKSDRFQKDSNWHIPLLNFSLYKLQKSRQEICTYFKLNVLKQIKALPT